MSDKSSSPSATSRGLIVSHLRDFADFLPEKMREDFNATIDDAFAASEIAPLSTEYSERAERQQAASWLDVCNLLSELVPDWRESAEGYVGVDKALNTIRKLASAPSATPQKIKAVKVTVTIPEGWRLVPFEPTWEMLGARAVPGVLEGSDIALVWKAMLDVAPKLLAIKELEYVADFAE